MSRSVSSELDAAFAMPGLERIAAPLKGFVRSEPEAVALVGYLAARAAMGSANRLDDELSDDLVWRRIRSFAEKHGRDLPKARPTFNKLHHLRCRIDDASAGRLDEVLLEMNNAFIEESVELARSGGLLNPANVGDLRFPERPNTLFADGTWWEPLSMVRRHPETGELIGNSRSKGSRLLDGEWWTEAETAVNPATGELMSLPEVKVPGPRVSETLTTTKHGQVLVGIPFVMVGVHGDRPDERVVLGLRRFVSPLLSEGTGETPAADELLSRVLSRSGDGAQWLIYDMAFRGESLRKLASQGVVGIAAMPSAPEASERVILTGDGQYSYNNDPRKEYGKMTPIRLLRHNVDGYCCEHSLTAVDGALRCHDPSERATAVDALCPLLDLRFEGEPLGLQRLIAVYEVPCNRRRLPIELDLTGVVNGTNMLMLNQLRPISEYDEMFAAVKGWRQDVENLNSIMKRVVPLDGQATSLKPAHFELDVLGSALWVNSKFWDLRVETATHSAQRKALTAVKRARLQPAI